MSLFRATQHGNYAEVFSPAVNAKTPSFFALKGFFGISKEMEQDLLKFGDSFGETVRYCLHNNPQESLHVMLIYHPCKKEIPQQIFEYTDSYYILQDGSFKLIDLNTREEVLIDKNHCSIGKIGKNTPYQMEILSDSVLFIEIRGW